MQSQQGSGYFDYDLTDQCLKPQYTHLSVSGTVFTFSIDSKFILEETPNLIQRLISTNSFLFLTIVSATELNFIMQQPPLTTTGDDRLVLDLLGSVSSLLDLFLGSAGLKGLQTSGEVVVAVGRDAVAVGGDGGCDGGWRKPRLRWRLEKTAVKLTVAKENLLFVYD
ncbi:hypothetical protein L1987_54565 [Smallanthus sonchifolius]|uniref:Uncharacterized protein n=1 Tax=Smallanthus sonchifolius TaxID=185202 RepID=A0ACB9E7G9_9ASTR|nr:hypothetical protein L1987_54565 [Smallanthus sonchifolius]